MKKQPKVERELMAEAQAKAERAQLFLRMEQELRTRLDELGAQCGRTANQFVVEAMDRYGDVLADAMLEEDQEIQETRQRHRDQLRANIQSTRR
jgi:predicted DNA-binding protein